MSETTDDRLIAFQWCKRRKTEGTAMSGTGETELEMAQRHAHEGVQRLERQRALISGLIRDGHHRLLPAARKLLDQMEQYQVFIEGELERLLRKQQRKTPP